MESRVSGTVAVPPQLHDGWRRACPPRSVVRNWNPQASKRPLSDPFLQRISDNGRVSLSEVTNGPWGRMSATKMDERHRWTVERRIRAVAGPFPQASE